MKFKKVTFAGVVLALALALGLTVAFASSPASTDKAAGVLNAGDEDHIVYYEVEVEGEDLEMVATYQFSMDEATVMEYDAAEGVVVNPETGEQFRITLQDPADIRINLQDPAGK